MSHPWDQLPNEGSAAYRAFREYLQLGMERTLGEIATALDREPKVIYRVAADFNWIKRARAYDRWLIQTEETAIRKSTEKSAVTWAQRRSNYRELEWTLAGELIQKAKEILALPVTEQKIERDTLSEDGTQRHTVIIIKPVKVNPRDAAVILKTASELARLSAGMETEKKLLSIDVRGGDEERLLKAKQTYERLQDQYRNRPDVLQFLPQWVAEDWDVSPELLLGAGTGEQPVIDADSDNGSSN